MYKRQDLLNGGDGVDFLNGGEGSDILFGGAGNDGFFGGGGNDLISGDDGDDRVYGDGGNDIIQGGRGSDILSGGQINYVATSAGNDTFVWAREDVLNLDGSQAGVDKITDFNAGDRLDFSGLMAGRSGFDPHALVRVTDSATGTMVSVDMGSGFADVVLLQDVHVADVDALLPQIVL